MNTTTLLGVATDHRAPTRADIDRLLAGASGIEIAPGASPLHDALRRLGSPARLPKFASAAEAVAAGQLVADVGLIDGQALAALSIAADAGVLVAGTFPDEDGELVCEFDVVVDHPHAAAFVPVLERIVTDRAATVEAAQAAVWALRT
jgi:hypothetical protein